MCSSLTKHVLYKSKYFTEKPTAIVKMHAFIVLVETMFMRYKNKRRRKEKQLETRLQREHM